MPPSYSDVSASATVPLAWVPERLRAYAFLMRWHQPTGIWLLFWPCAWAATLAARAMGEEIPWGLLLLFLLGSVAMRGAGCIVNDLADRRFDAEVARTRSRPLASGALTVRQAVGCLLLLLLIGGGVLLMLRPATIWLGLAALPLVVAYPFMKRITHYPQAFLGLTFNWGALVGWMEVTGTLSLPALLLYPAGVCWTLGYDTIYALQDRQDDARIGVKSTALRFGNRVREWVVGFYLLAWLFWCAAGALGGAGVAYTFAMLLVAGLLALQILRMDTGEAHHSAASFRLNRWVGAWVWVGIAIPL
jgi:4-hydroxybenzoate polyprenyltransferase